MGRNLDSKPEKPNSGESRPVDNSANADRRKLFKKTIVLFCVCAVVAAYIIGRLVWIQIVNHEKYQAATMGQTTVESVIPAKRGTIYDCNMKVLGVSVAVERVFISPKNIPQMTVAEYIEEKSEGMTPEKKAEFASQFENTGITVSEDIADMLSRELSVEKEKVLEKTKKVKRLDETIARKVDTQICDILREEVAAKKYSNCVHFNEDTKRYYPYSNLASHIIGHTNYDNNGVYGIEAYYNEILTGVDGKQIKAQNAVGEDLSYKYESYVSAEDGTGIQLTIDWTVQSILEKHLQTLLEETEAKQKVCGIILDVTDGSILAMSTKPDYNLNDPYTLDDSSLALLDAFVGTEEEKSNYKSQLTFAMWKNKAITEIYEPGSTFKMITAAMALEEKKVTLNDQFYCKGYETVSGWGKPINCHLRSGHGAETFAEGLKNSCNPVFIQVGLRVGNDTFYKYFDAFGYFDKSNIDLFGETTGIFHERENFNIVELAVSSFGQTFKVTPIQHIAACAAVANGGKLITPHLLKATVDSDGNVIEEYKPNVVRQVISEETSKTIMKIMEEGVSQGGAAKNAYVSGYRVAAKTGTSQKRDVDYTAYIASCMAFAPADNPKIAILILVDEPQGKYYGGLVAAPAVSKVLAEVLPCLDIDPIYTDIEKESIGVAVADYTGLSVDSAKAALTKNGLKYKVVGDGATVSSQIPTTGSTLLAGGIVMLYTDGSTAEKDIAVPDLTGYSASNANQLLTNIGLNISLGASNMDQLSGATAYAQSIAPGTLVAPGTIVQVDFRHVQGTSD